MILPISQARRNPLPSLYKKTTGFTRQNWHLHAFRAPDALHAYQHEQGQETGRRLRRTQSLTLSATVKLVSLGRRAAAGVGRFDRPSSLCSVVAEALRTASGPGPPPEDRPLGGPELVAASVEIGSGEGGAGGSVGMEGEEEAGGGRVSVGGGDRTGG